MQRVAIARALVNDPDILLADEPIGALDTETSVQVMELLKQVAKDRLVVMVTHNPELADTYATRIVRLTNGKIADDSDSYTPDAAFVPAPKHENMGKASMSFLTALSLSFNNLRTKKGRTFLTAFAGSIGIIGIALILSLSNGVNTYIEDLQKDTMSSCPVTIDAQSMDLTSILESGKENTDSASEEADHELNAVYSDSSSIEMASSVSTSITENNLTAFKAYLDDPDSDIQEYIGENGIQYTYDVAFSVYAYDPEGTLVNTDGSTLEEDSDDGSSMISAMSSLMSSDGNDNFEEMMASADGEAISAAAAYTHALTEYLMEYTNESAVVQAQMPSADINVISGVKFDPEDDAAKAADTKVWIRTLTETEKADMCREILNTVYFDDPEAAKMMLDMDDASLAAMPDEYVTGV